LQSALFIIADSAFKTTAQKALKGLYSQRCGTALKNAYAGPYARGVCHSADAVFHSSCDTSGYAETRGGWHDAGDYGKYMVPAASAAGTLLMSYEYFPEFSAFDDLNIPESGNRIPDLLDETRWELNWMLKMQNQINEAVYFKVTAKKFVGCVISGQSREARYIYESSSTATADFAAVMARAYRVYAAFDSGFAQICLNAAQRAWQWLQMHSDIVPKGGFHNPADTETGEYGDDKDSDERLWAAAELFEATAEKCYNQYFQNHYKQSAVFDEQMSWENEKAMAQTTYLKSRQPAASAAVKKTIRNALFNYCNEQVQTANNDGFRVAMEGREYYWGSNSVALNKAIMLIIAFNQGGSNAFKSTALAQLNYILGSNAHDMSFVSGVGIEYPRHIHHAPSMAGGPNKYLDDRALQAAFTAETPPALCYLDNVESYASNKIAVYWNAPLIFVSAYFSKGFDSMNTVESEKIRAHGFLLSQNYPNPFNSGTTIRYRLAAPGFVYLSIYNILGQKEKPRRSAPTGRYIPGRLCCRWTAFRYLSLPVERKRQSFTNE